MRAKCTFINVSCGQNGPHGIWTGYNAGFTSGAFFTIHQDNSLRSFIRSSGGAHFYAGSILAMETLLHAKFTLQIRIFTLYSFPHSQPEVSERYFIFGFTGNDTRLASDAPISINGHCISSHFTTP
jgi:hypothetical protein